MISRFEHSPWDFWTQADAESRERQRETLSQLRSEHPGWTIGAQCFVSELASVHPETLALGDRTYVAAGAYLTGTIRVGADCSVNPYTVLRGDVVLGDGVRIGAHTSILGFNHTMDDPAVPVFRQPLVAKGIRVGDDVWIGSHVVILDGVTVGAHSVLAAGAVVTKDVPDGAIVGGNPARLLRWRIPPVAARTPTTRRPPVLGDRLAALGATARAQASAILDRSWNPAPALFVDRPGVPASVRAHCDAVEIADLLLSAAPPQLAAEAHIARLRSWQDARNGAVAELDDRGRQRSHPSWDDPDVAYHAECVGYALDLLGSSFPHALTMITDSSAPDVSSLCEALPWRSSAWAAGHRVDAIGTALMWSIRRGDAVPTGLADALFGWLLTHTDPQTGMWGRPGADDGFLQVVNGFYRATRGTFAQFDVPLPHPDRVIDTVLLHARDPHWFGPDAVDACNVLDVAHPLWLATRLESAAPHRRDEVVALAEQLISAALDRWVDGAGFAFRPGRDNDGAPGLQGTEMWLSIIWYLSDILGLSTALGFRPRGIHRPEAAMALAAAGTR